MHSLARVRARCGCKLGQRLLVPRPREQISLARDALHLLAAPLVILAYSCVEFWSIMEVTGHNTYTMNTF